MPEPDGRSTGPRPTESMNTSARAILELNIRHYGELLKITTDRTRRAVIAKLRAEEAERLAALPAGRPGAT